MATTATAKLLRVISRSVQGRGVKSPTIEIQLNCEYKWQSSCQLIRMINARNLQLYQWCANETRQ